MFCDDRMWKKLSYLKKIIKKTIKFNRERALPFSILRFVDYFKSVWFISLHKRVKQFQHIDGVNYFFLLCLWNPTTHNLSVLLIRVNFTTEMSSIFDFYSNYFNHRSETFQSIITNCTRSH